MYVSGAAQTAALYAVNWSAVARRRVSASSKPQLHSCLHALPDPSSPAEATKGSSWLLLWWPQYHTAVVIFIHVRLKVLLILAIKSSKFMPYLNRITSKAGKIRQNHRAWSTLVFNWTWLTCCTSAFLGAENMFDWAESCVVRGGCLAMRESCGL